ncbi:MAG: hypothetical protein Q8M56_00400 [Desulfobacterales bacterium]|jgi:hypothetical protein|nr:hypothetical protein [Desulfobacterales bacterium]
MKRTFWYAAMIHPVELALPSRAARIQQGGDEAQSAAADRMTFYEAVNYFPCHKQLANDPIFKYIFRTG